MTLSISTADAARVSEARRGGSPRLLLPVVATVVVSMRPEALGVQAPAPKVAAIGESGDDALVTFDDLPLGLYTVTAEAKDAAGAARFKRSARLEVVSGGASATLTLLPINADGSEPEAVGLSSPVSGTLAPGETRVLAVAPSEGSKAYVSLSAAEAVRFYCQDADGELLTADPALRRAVGEAGVSSLVTLYNAGSEPQAYSVALSGSPLVAWWKFDGCTDVARDLGDSISSAEASAIGNMMNYPGSGYRSNGAIRLNGIDTYLSLPAMAIAELEAPWTVSAWVSHGEADAVQPLACGSSGNAILVAKEPAYQVSVSAGGSSYSFGDSVAPDDEWTHVAVVNTGSELLLYLNGRRAGVALADPACAAMRLPLSRLGSDGASAYFRGYLDDFRAYQDALPAPELALVHSRTPRQLAIAPVSRGTVTVDPDKPYYELGEVVTLAAAPEDSTWKFDGWTGAASGSSPTATIVMDADKTVGAAFSTAVPRANVTFSANGGADPGPDPVPVPVMNDVIVGTSITMPSPGYGLYLEGSPTRRYPCWNRLADGSGYRYWPGDMETITGDMTLYAEWDEDDGPDFAGRASAFIIPTGSAKRGFIQYKGDQDYYKIEIAVAGTLVIDVTAVGAAYYDASLGDSATNGPMDGGNTLGLFDTGAVRMTTPQISRSVTAGTYYLWIGWAGGANYRDNTGEYLISTTFTP